MPPGRRPPRWYPAEVRVGLLVSGTGSIAEQMLAQGLPVAVVLADRSCRALQMAQTRAVATELVDRSRFGGFGPGFDRDGFSEALTAALQRHGVDLVVMAGFGTIVSRSVHDAFPHRVLNTHPSLLPAFPGWHAVDEALAAGATVSGCTVHLAELAMDQGPILAQQAVPVVPGDDAAALHERIKAVERVLYPATVRRVLRALAAGMEPADLPTLVGTVDAPLRLQQLGTAAGVGPPTPAAAPSTQTPYFRQETS